MTTQSLLLYPGLQACGSGGGVATTAPRLPINLHLHMQGVSRRFVTRRSSYISGRLDVFIVFTRLYVPLSYSTLYYAYFYSYIFIYLILFLYLLPRAKPSVQLILLTSI